MTAVQKTSPDDIALILAKLPTDDYESAQKLCERLLGGGRAVVSQLVESVGNEFGDPEGVKPKYAVHALVMHAARPGAAAQREMVAEALANELEGDHSDELKAFIVRQLQLCGRPDEVAALARLLTSDRLCGPATQALTAIGGDGALAALREALPKADGKREVAIRQALGILERQ